MVPGFKFTLSLLFCFEIERLRLRLIDFFVLQSLATFTLQALMLSVIQWVQLILQKILCTTVSCSCCMLLCFWYYQTNNCFQRVVQISDSNHGVTSCLLSQFMGQVLYSIVLFIIRSHLQLNVTLESIDSIYFINTILIKFVTHMFINVLSYTLLNCTSFYLFWFLNFFCNVQSST